MAARSAPAPKASVRAANDAAAMAKLRQLIVGADDERIAEILPKAVTIRARTDRQLGFALEPIIADTLGDVARKHPEKLADALAPMVGHAVRKAVGAAFAALLERLDQALQHTFSARAIRWRIEAARTGRPFAEVVLLHSLVFRVEQVFLTHRRTGLLLAHAAADPEQARDPDQVAGMLTAIESFVRDAFREGQELTRFEVGDLQARIDVGPEAALTAIVRGTPREDLDVLLQEALERIHIEHRDALARFRGDTAPFASTQDVLSGLLLEQQRPRRRSVLLPLVAIGLALLVGVWTVRGVLGARRAEERLRAQEAALAAEPGIIVTSSARDGDHLTLAGLRDPLAVEPAAVLAARGLDASRTTLRFAPFYSTDPRLAERRAAAVLAPPSTIGLSVERGALRLRGIASREWLKRARTIAAVLPGVAAVDATAARDEESIAAVRGALDAADGSTFLFPLKSAQVDRRDEPRLDEAARALRTIVDNAAGAGVTVVVAVDAYADSPGSHEANLRLSDARANAVAAELSRRGVPDALIVPRAFGERAAGEREGTARRVVVRVVLDGAAPTGTP